MKINESEYDPKLDLIHPKNQDKNNKIKSKLI